MEKQTDNPVTNNAESMAGYLEYVKACKQSIVHQNDSNSYEALLRLVDAARVSPVTIATDLLNWH